MQRRCAVQLQDVIDKARTVLVGNRNMLQKMQASMGVPFVSDLDDPAFAQFKQVFIVNVPWFAFCGQYSYNALIIPLA